MPFLKSHLYFTKRRRNTQDLLPNAIIENVHHTVSLLRILEYPNSSLVGV